MGSVHRSAHVPYSAAQMYALVNDVESYPEFLHWCRGARVTQRGADFVDATLDIGLAGIHRAFSTRNALDPTRRIGVSLLAGPFRRLEGEWLFDETEDGGCDVSLTLDFAVRSSPLGIVFANVFEEIARSQMKAFLKRAEDLYGRR